MRIVEHQTEHCLKQPDPKDCTVANGACSMLDFNRTADPVGLGNMHQRFVNVANY